MSHILLEILIRNYDDSPIVITGPDGSVTWMNDAFIRAFPAFKTDSRGSLNRELEFLYDESSLSQNGRFTSRTFKCVRLSSRNKSMIEGISISDSNDTLYRFEPNLISGDEIIEKISVVNMELA